MNIIGKKYWYFAISLIVIIPGIISLFLFGLKPSIDFSGGSRLTFSHVVKESDVVNAFAANKIAIVSLQKNATTLTVRTKPIDTKENNAIVANAQKINPSLKEDEFA